jgi:hypothetical protein
LWCGYNPSWIQRRCPELDTEVTFHRNPASLAYSTRIQCSGCYTSPCSSLWVRLGPTTHNHIVGEPCGSCIDRRAQEIQYEWGQASFDIHVDHDGSRWGQRGRSCGPEGIPKHDRIPTIPDDDETRHPIRGLFVRALSVFVAHVSSSSRQADPQVPSFYTRVWSLVFDLFFSFSLWVFRCELCWLSCWEEVHFRDLLVSWIFSSVLVFSQAI